MIPVVGLYLSVWFVATFGLYWTEHNAVESDAANLYRDLPSVRVGRGVASGRQRS